MVLQASFFVIQNIYVNSNPGTYLEFYFDHCKPSYFDNIRSLLTKKLVAVKHQTFKCGMQWLFNYLIIFQNIYFWFKSPIILWNSLHARVNTHYKAWSIKYIYSLWNSGATYVSNKTLRQFQNFSVCFSIHPQKNPPKTQQKPLYIMMVMCHGPKEKVYSILDIFKY